MHYIRPLWLTHSGEKKDFEVYSCHISPDGLRLVTAAGGNISTRSGVQNLLNQITQTAIHTVRFSSNGKYLASGADDKIVCVYTLDPNPPSHSATFGMRRNYTTGNTYINTLNQEATKLPQLRTGASFVD